MKNFFLSDLSLSLWFGRFLFRMKTDLGINLCFIFNNSLCCFPCRHRVRAGAHSSKKRTASSKAIYFIASITERLREIRVRRRQFICIRNQFSCSLSLCIGTGTYFRGASFCCNFSHSFFNAFGFINW